MLIFIIACLWIALALAVGVMASGRGRKGFGWTILACLISPALAGIFLLAIADLSPHAQRPVQAAHVECPECGGRILRQARVCMHCRAELATSWNRDS